MADQYFVSPESNEVVAIPEENAQKALSLKYAPASESQIAAFKAKDEALKSPVSSFFKRAAESAVSALSPTDIAYGALALPTATEAAEIVGKTLADYTPDWAKKASAALTVGTALEKQRALEKYGVADVERAGRETMQAAIRPLTVESLEIASGLTTPEAYRARAETGPKVTLPLLGETPVADLVGLVGAATLPRKLAKVAISGRAKAAEAAAAEAAHVDALDSARRLLAEKANASALTREAAIIGQPSVLLGPEEQIAQRMARVLEAPTPDLAATMKAATEAGEKVVESAAAAEARAQLLAKIPGGEKIARGFEKALKAGADANALELVGNVAGRPVSRLVETSARNLIEKAPALSKAPQAVKDIVARALATGAGSAADMALLSLGQIPQEELLGDTRVTAEQALANMKNAALSGFKLGAVIGGAPPAIVSGVDAIGAASSKIRNAFLDLYPRVSAPLTGASAESYAALESMRDSLSRPDAVDLIERKIAETMGPEPKPPTPMPAAPTVAVTTDLPTEPAAYEARPRPTLEFDQQAPGKPKLWDLVSVPKANEVKLKPVDFDRVASELAKEMQGRSDMVDDLLVNFNTKIRRAEEAPLINHYYDVLAEQVRSGFEEQLAGRKPTAKDNQFLMGLMQKVYEVPRDEATRLSTKAKEIIKQVANDEPRAVPLQTLMKLDALADEMANLATDQRALPSDVADKIGDIKRRAFDLTKPRVRGEVILQEEQIARRAANDFGHEIIRSLENDKLWGDNAVREQMVNKALTNYTTSRANVLGDLGVTEQVGIKTKEKIFDPGEIKKLFSKLTSAEQDTVLRHFQEHEAAVDALVNQIKISAKKYEGPHNLSAVSEAMGRTAKAYTAAESEFFSKLDNDYALQMNEKLRADAEQFNRYLKKLNSDLTSDYKKQVKAFEEAEAEAQKKFEQAKLEYVEQEGVRRLEASEAMAKYKAEIEDTKNALAQAKQAFKERQQTIDAENLRAKEAFDNQLAMRRGAVDRQIKLLNQGAKLGALGDTVKMLKYFGGRVVAGGAVLSGHPVLGAAIATGDVLYNPIRTYRTISALEKAARKTQAATEDFVDWAAGYRKSVPAEYKPETAGMSAAQKRKLFEERTRMVEDLSTPRGMEDHLDRMASEIDGAAPKIAAYSRTVSATALAYLRNAIPQPPPGLSPMQQAAYVAPDNKVNEYMQKHDTVENPTGALYRVAEGSATQAEVNTLNAVYPLMMQDVRQRMLKRLRETPDMPANRRRVISRMLGIDIDGAISAGATAQKTYLEQNRPPAIPKPIGSQIPSGRAAALNVAGREAQDTVDRREDQRGARR